METFKKCRFILDNLRKEDLLEIECLWGNNWKQKVLNSIDKKKVLFAYGRDKYGNIIPISMGGFHDIPCEHFKVACVWLLSTKYISMNKIRFFKELRTQFFLYEKNYEILYNYIYKTNIDAKRWLKKLGFCFDNPKPANLKISENFEFFYKNRKEF